MNLAQGIALQDPLMGVTDRIGDYWATDNQKRLINSLQGILADNVANDSGDLLHTVATDAAGAVTDAEKASALNFIKALELTGDKLDLNRCNGYSLKRLLWLVCNEPYYFC